MKPSRRFMHVNTMMGLAALLILVCCSLLNFLFFSANSWQQPFFTLFEGFVSVLIFITVFIIFAWYSIKQDRTNERLLNKTKHAIDELERQLKQNMEEKERFELFVQATGDGLWDWNLNNNEFYFSSRWKSILGFNEDEFEGSFIEWQNLVHPEDLGKLLDMWSKCTNGDTNYTIEYRIKNKFGRYIWVASRTIALIDESGDVYRLAGSHTDITTKKESELKLLNHQKNLEAAIAEHTIDLEQANKRLKELASIDGLTGLNNRRAFDEAIKREWNRCKRDQKTFSLIMLDIDFFKQYNDTFGHLEGDIVLKKLSRVLTEKVRRSTDIVARYGGEEFVVILPDADQKQTLDIAHNIQKSVKQLNIPAVNQFAYENITFSMGIGTTIPDDSNSWESTLEQVDQALYHAKRTGRNKIIISPLNIVNLKIPCVHE